MRTGWRHIADGSAYNRYFPNPKSDRIVIKEYADIPDTVNLMKKVIRETLDDTKNIAQKLRAGSVYETCRRVWDFTFRHLQYKRDTYGKEEVRRPARAWLDGQKKGGVDCDCMTVFVGSILTNLKIPFKIRLTNYSKEKESDETNDFEHVYPVAMIGNKEIVMDCVVHAFNYEVTYKQKKDIKMELHYLNGIGMVDDFTSDTNANFLGDLFGEDFTSDEIGLLVAGTDLEGLEGKAERKAKRQERRQERKATPLKLRGKNTIQRINKVNPATALLRAGILASMKLNVMNVAGKLRFAYMRPEQARSNKMDMAKYIHLIKIRQRLEKIFTGAGGKVENLKEAILKGKANKDRKVSLNGLEGLDASRVNDWQELDQILGYETYRDEFTDESLGSVNGLGSITAAAAVASASGIIGKIYSMIKKIGELFPKGSAQNITEVNQERESEKEDKKRKFSKDGIAQFIRLNPKALEPIPYESKLPNDPTPIPKYVANNSPLETESEVDQDLDVSSTENQVTTQTASDEVTKDGIDPNANKETKGLWGWITENPGLSALIGGGIIATGIGLSVYLKRKKKKNKSQQGSSLSGINSKKQSKKKKRKNSTRLAQTPPSQYIKKLELL